MAITTTSRGKSGRKYRYYVSASLQQGSRPIDSDRVQRVSAPGIEKVIAAAIQQWMPQADNPFAPIRSICLSDRGLQISIGNVSAANLAARLADDETILDRTTDAFTILLPIRYATRGSMQMIVPAREHPPQPDYVLISALRKAHAMLRIERCLLVIDTAPSSPYDRNILQLAILAPDIQRAILDGRQPLHLNLEALKKMEIPLAWSRQRKALGFADVGAPCSAEKIP